MSKKWTIQEIRDLFKKEGYILLSSEYKNMHTKLEYICSNGHYSSVLFSNWLFNGKRCKYCSKMSPVKHKDVKTAFEKEGYILISTEYIKSSAKLEFVCNKGHRGFMSWNSFQQGHRCKKCYTKNQKPTIDDIRVSFAIRGAVLLDTEYINNKSKLTYVCKNGHKQRTTWNSWNAGHGCPECSDNVKLTIEYIRAEFAKENYILLDDVYKGNKTKLKYKCPKGHTHSVSWGKWLYGRRCPSCIGGTKLDYGYIKDSFEKEGYFLLTKEYKNSSSLLSYICPNGHKSTTQWVNWKKGSRCRRCFADSTKLPFDQVKASFDREGYCLVSSIYENSTQKLKVTCPLGHSYSVSWCNWSSGYRCPVCAVIKNSGPTHYNWKGDISCEPYCPSWNDKEFKEYIKERDSYKCLNPYCDSKNAKDLTIHHIDYNKKNCSPKNLITVCRSCNSKANTDREWHEAWYKAIMYKRYYIRRS